MKPEIIDGWAITFDPRGFWQATRVDKWQKHVKTAATYDALLPKVTSSAMQQVAA